MTIFRRNRHSHTERQHQLTLANQSFLEAEKIFEKFIFYCADQEVQSPTATSFSQMKEK